MKMKYETQPKLCPRCNRSFEAQKLSPRKVTLDIGNEFERVVTARYNPILCGPCLQKSADSAKRRDWQEIEEYSIELMTPRG